MTHKFLNEYYEHKSLKILRYIFLNTAVLLLICNQPKPSHLIKISFLNKYWQDSLLLGIYYNYFSFKGVMLQQPQQLLCLWTPQVVIGFMAIFATSNKQIL